MAKREIGLLPIRVDGRDSALLFIHGFAGYRDRTWGSFPELLAKEPTANPWDIYCVGFSSGKSPSIEGVTEYLPGLQGLADWFRLQIAAQELCRYRSLVLIAHSMGGLMVQRALLDEPTLIDKTSHVAFFATPSRGSWKAFWMRAWSRQARDMNRKGKFITKLRKDWHARFADGMPFEFLTVAGDQDEFVRLKSALSPFPLDKARVIPGRHKTIVKPGPGQDEGLRLVLELLHGETERKESLRNAET